MPELPEVETIRRGLADRLIGDSVSSVDVRVSKMFIGDITSIFNVPITAVRRVAKVLIIDFSNDKSIIIHLKMTGQLVYVDTVASNIAVGGHPEKVYQHPLPHKHTHIIYSLNSGATLYYNDLRKFGWHKIVDTEDIVTLLGKEFAGVDVSGDTFTLNYFQSFLKLRPKRPIKEAVLEQRYLAGLGNIYAAEALWHAKIRPDRLVQSLSVSEQEALYEGIKYVINLSLTSGGSSFNSYIDVAGQQGSFLQYAEVYKRNTDSLGHEIQRIKQGGRTTHFCPVCQK
jgi:formamidopyrimidine-DNA glycosylase